MLIRYIVKQLSGYVSCQKWLSPCQDARASTHFLYVPDHFSKWPQRLFSLKEQLATPLWQRLVTLVQALNLKTGRRGGKNRPPSQDLRTESNIHHCISYWHTIASMRSPPWHLQKLLPPRHPCLAYRFTALWASILLPARNVTPPKMAKYFRVWNMLSWVQ